MLSVNPEISSFQCPFKSLQKASTSHSRCLYLKAARNLLTVVQRGTRAGCKLPVEPTCCSIHSQPLHHVPKYSFIWIHISSIRFAQGKTSG